VNQLLKAHALYEKTGTPSCRTRAGAIVDEFHGPHEAGRSWARDGTKAVEEKKLGRSEGEGRDEEAWHDHDSE